MVEIEVARPGPEMTRAIEFALEQAALPTLVYPPEGTGSKGAPAPPQKAGAVPFEKKCSCCGRVFDERSWQLLYLLGYAGDRGTRFELRDCPCENTLWRRIR